MQQMQNKPQPRTFSTKKVSNEISYANAVQTRKVQPSNPQSSTTYEEHGSMQQMMKQLMDMFNQFAVRLDRLEARATGAIPKKK